MAVGLGLRVALFSGYGLGDDPNYFSAYHGNSEAGTWSEHVPYDFRFAFWTGVVGFLKLVGITEWGWVGFVTLCSVLNMPLAYALARQEWGREWGLLVMALLAVFPLDVMTSTLFAVDIPLATYCYTAFWLYRVACGRRVGSVVRIAVASGVFLFLGYSAKQWGGLNRCPVRHRGADAAAAAVAPECPMRRNVPCARECLLLEAVRRSALRRASGELGRLVRTPHLGQPAR